MSKNIGMLLKNISYRENVILIEFSKDMNISNGNLEHSFLNFTNYAIERNKKLHPFPYGTKVIQIEFGFIIQFTLPKNFLDNIYDNAIVHIGYIERRKIFYIQSADGSIPNVCSINFLGKEIELLDLNNGLIKIIDEKTLHYFYNGENRFYKLSEMDFYINKENIKYYPKIIKKINYREFILIFKENILKRTYGVISLNVKNNPLSEDLYGFKIKGNIQVDLIELMETYLKSFSFCDYNEKNKIGYFKLYFSNPINFFSVDFKIKINNNLLDIIATKTNNDKTIIHIITENLQINNIDNSIFEFFTFVDFNDVKTIDNEWKKVFIKNPIKTTVFRSFNIDWKLKDYNFSKSIIKIDFDKTLNTKSLIEDYSIFNSYVNFWSGEKISVKPGSLIMEYEKDIITNKNILTLRIDKNDSFGKIVIQEKYDFNCISLNNISNIKPCYIYVENNKLFLEFDEKEDMDGILVFIKDIKYYPHEGIQNMDESFIFYGYKPTGTCRLDDNIIYIEPLNYTTENPFKGEKIFKNYILGINDNKKCRDYGDTLNVTEINGFLKMVGRLETGEIAKLQNLKVLGTIIVDASKTNVNFENVECSKNIEIKTR